MICIRFQLLSENLVLKYVDLKRFSVHYGIRGVYILLYQNILTYARNLHLEEGLS